MKALSTTARIKAIAKRIGRSVTTLYRWQRQGCDLNSPASINEYLEGNELRRNANLVRRGKADVGPNDTTTPDLNAIELGPIGKLGAAASLARLEFFEVQAHTRLLQAIESGDPLRIKAAGEFYLRTNEVLRRLDLSIEIERRNAVELIPQKQVEAVALYIAEWLRIAFAQFLSSESRSLMGIKNLGEFNLYAVDRFRGIIFAAVKTSRKTNSPIPTWAEGQVHVAWGGVDAMNRNSKRRAKLELRLRRANGEKLTNPKSKRHHPWFGGRSKRLPISLWPIP
jgi:hypothetical protein